MSGIDHYREAERALERADHISNSDNWPGGDRPLDVANKLAEALVHATLAHADAVTEASNAGSKAIYDGQI